jgi:hypothetical protein
MNGKGACVGMTYSKVKNKQKDDEAQEKETQSKKIGECTQT